MAELILTDEEKAAALWSDLDDESIGKLVRKKIAFLQSAANQMDRVITHAAAMLLCSAAAECGAAEMKLDLGGLTQDGQQFGDWTVLVTKNNPRPEGDQTP